MELKYSFALGFDIHPLVEGRKLRIGGVEIPSSFGPLGHSDGDALLHALMDAMLSASGLPDIGTLFPDNDPAYKDIDSTLLLEKVLEAISQRGYKVYQVDLTLILDKPKLSPFYEAIKENLSRLLRISKERVGLKAKTSEGLLFPKESPAIMVFSLIVLEKV
ncbi:MAG: 2-C-methyl-D-erythritol 2,4-cyclodiphosphate synthase [Caldimicrobium sp.]